MTRRIKMMAGIFFCLTGLFFSNCGEDNSCHMFTDPTGIIKVFNYGNPQWGANDIIAFSCTPFDSSGNLVNDSSGFWTMNADGSNKKIFYFANNGYIHEFVWSPDARWFAFDNGQIYKRNFESGVVFQLTTGIERKFFPSWSPDGKVIAFSIDEGPQRGIWTVDSNGQNMRPLKTMDSIILALIEPSWSPNGHEIACKVNLPIQNSFYSTGFTNLAVFDTLTKTTKIILVKYPQRISGPTFSPDGAKIVFSAQGDNEDPQIWIINKDGTHLEQLTDDSGVEPAWSPDGTKIIYAKRSRCDINTPGNGKLWIMNPDGSGQKQFTY